MPDTIRTYNESTKLILKRIQPPSENIQSLITSIEIDSKLCRAAEPFRSLNTDKAELDKIDTEIIQGIGVIMKQPQAAASANLLNNEYKELSAKLFNHNDKKKEWQNKYEDLKKKYNPSILKPLVKDNTRVKQAFAEISVSATESENLQQEYETLKIEMNKLKKKIEVERIRLFSSAQPATSRPD